MFTTSPHAAQSTATACRPEPRTASAHIDPAYGRPTPQELIQWGSVYGDEVDCSIDREEPTRLGQPATATQRLASREALIQWVSVYGDEVVVG